MTIADNLTLLNSTKQDIKAAIEAKGVNMTGVAFTDYDTKIGEITTGPVIPTPDIGTAPYNTWVRNPAWLPLPTLTKGVSPQQVNMLVAVYNNASNGLAFQITGATTIDWGDGTVENFMSNAVATHTYSYTNPALDGTLVNGYKQAVVTITPQAGQNLTVLFLNRQPFTGQATGNTCPVLDLQINAPLCTSIYFTSSFVRFSMMEQVKFIDTGILTAFGGFTDCYSLRNIEIGNLDMFKSITYTNLFSTCSSLEEIPFFNTPSGSFAADSMCANCRSLKHFPALDMSRATTTANMFQNCSNLINVELTNISASTNTSAMFQSCLSLQKVGTGALTMPNTTTCLNMFDGCKNLITYGDITINVATTLSAMFRNCSNLYTVGNINVPLATSASNMFFSCRNLITVNSLTGPNLANVANMFYATSIDDISTFQFGTAKITNADGMFTGTRLVDITTSMPDLSVASNVYAMFSTCYYLETVPSTINISSATNAAFMFSLARELNDDITFVTSTSLANVANMFAGCESLEVAPTISINATGNAGSMFQDCYSLTDIDNVQIQGNMNMEAAFQSCLNLESIADPSKVIPNNSTNLNNIFNSCYSLVDVPPITLTNTTLNRTSTAMFIDCKSLKNIEINGLRTTSAASMFMGCGALQSVRGTIDFAPATTVSSVFANCYGLREIEVLSGPTSGTATMSNLFLNNVGLSKLTMSGMANTFTLLNCMLGPTELNAIYTSLATVTGKTITVTGNWGTASDNPAIATAKGWTVVG